MHRKGVASKNAVARQNKKAVAVARDPDAVAAPSVPSTRADAGPAPAPKSRAKAAARPKPEITLPKLDSVAAGNPFRPPRTYLHEADEVPRRIRVYYRRFKGAPREGFSSRIAGEDYFTPLREVLRWAWMTHTAETGEPCPHAWLGLGGDGGQ